MAEPTDEPGTPALRGVLQSAFVAGPAGPRRSDAFLHGAQATLSFAPRPLYAALHERIHAQGGRATAWSAHRVREEFPEFDADSDGPFRFTGEMI